MGIGYEMCHNAKKLPQGTIYTYVHVVVLLKPDYNQVPKAPMATVVYLYSDKL